jgi:choline dehydrogenase
MPHGTRDRILNAAEVRVLAGGPAALMLPLGSRFYDWGYRSERERHLGDREIYHARGKLLGGSSSINGMIFQRGTALDYDGWAAEPGLENWSYAHCLPYFKRMETAPEGEDRWRGRKGPLRLERGPARQRGTTRSLRSRG